MTRIFHLILLFLVCTNMQAQPRLKAAAESVLDKLYQVNGNKVYPKPAIEIISDNRNAAQFIRRTNTIQIGIKTFEVCRVFGKDSLSALAFVIGHEMAHSFQLNARQTSFLAYDQQEGTDANAEKDADIQGLFTTYLAGYNTADLLPYLIEGIYVVYDLKRKNLSGYPTLEERKRTANEVRLMVSELIRMYETGNYLAAIGHYDLAAACFGFVETQYKGREIYNNLGVNIALQAMHISEKTVDPYIFPLELDCDSRLKKPKADRGAESLTPEQWRQRGHLLAKAADYFALAVKMDYEYLPAEINYVSALVLNGKSAEAIEYCEGRELVKKSKLLNSSPGEQEKVKLALGLAYAYSLRANEAAELFNGLKASTNDFINYSARYNASVLTGIIPAASENPPCQIAFDTDMPVDGIKLHRPEGSAWVMLDNTAQIEISTIVKTNSDLLIFRVGGQNRVSLQRIRRRIASAPPPAPNIRRDIVATNQGYIEVCREKSIAVLFNEARDKTLEWVKYYEF